jgi:hypothetical protein
MSNKEFLQALARTFLIQWQVQGNTVTMQETPYSEADRGFLNLGDLGQYRILTRRSLNDRREEAELARLLKQEAGDALFTNEGVPITQLSEPVQKAVQREGQEIMFSSLLRLVNDFVPAALEEARLEIGYAAPPQVIRAGETPQRPTNPLAGALNLQSSYGEGLSVALRRPGMQTYLLTGLSDTPQPEPPVNPVERIMAAYKQAQGQRDEQIRRAREEARLRMQQNRANNQVPDRETGT